jgi:hypothetical protein
MVLAGYRVKQGITASVTCVEYLVVTEPQVHWNPKDSTTAFVGIQCEALDAQPRIEIIFAREQTQHMLSRVLPPQS